MAPRLIAPDRSSMVEHLFPKQSRIAEVGVQRGIFARTIYDACKPELLVLIDPWRHLTGAYELDPDNRPTRQKELEMEECRELVGEELGVVMMRMFSEEAAKHFEPLYFGAVYLDADHSELGIMMDLALWWPLIRHGGVLAGHDYCETPWIQVKPVVDEWVDRFGLELLVSGEPNWPSWAVVKP